MKNRFFRAAAWIWIWVTLPSLAFAQTDNLDLKAGNFGMDKILPAALNKGMSHKGKFIDGLRWKDDSGLNSLLLCYDTQPERHQRDIYVYQYREVGGKLSLVWDIQDFGAAMCEMTFVPNSLQLIDLDNDGVLESCFMYQNLCDGNDPIVTKMMLMKDGQKLAIRGKFTVEDNDEVEKNVDPSVAQYPAIFKNFMLMDWNEFKVGEFEYSKSIHIRTASFIVLQKEYLLASGGTEYEILNLDGQPMTLAQGMADKITHAITLDLMPDRKTLLYASLHGVGAYDPMTKQDLNYMTFLPETEAISAVTWSPDRTKIAFTAMNPKDYPQRTRIFVLSLAGNAMVKKEKFDARLMYMAASDWVVEAPWFKDNHSLGYMEMLIRNNEPREGGEKSITLE